MAHGYTAESDTMAAQEGDAAQQHTTVCNPCAMEMSREAQPPIDVDMESVQNLTVLDENNQRVRFGDIYTDCTTIVVLVRHFLCFACKEYVDDLSGIPGSYLQRANVKLVVIGCSPPRFIPPFRQATGYSRCLYVDPDRQLYKALKCREAAKRWHFGERSVHVKSSYVMGTFKSIWRGMQYHQMQGDMDQQGGAFILGPGNVAHFSHRDVTTTDHVPINDLLQRAGVETVNYHRDARVLDL